MRRVRPDWLPTPLVPPEARPRVEIGVPPRSTRFGATRVVARLAWFVALVTIRGGDAAARGRQFRSLLEDLGGLWVKLGQLLSLRVDLFPLEFCRELSQLQGRAVGFSPSEAMRIVEEDLGAPLAQLFSEFDATPLAAASIGQVHLAVLQGTGTRVAVKVQRPSLPLTFRQQFRVIRALVWLVGRTGYRSHMRWGELVWELQHIMLEEMDCRYEASSTRQMRKTLRRHRVYVPKVFHATRRVMVTEYVDGVLMTDYIRMLASDPARLRHWCTENRIDPTELGRHLVLSLLRQLIEDNLFHGDLHPGNIVLLRDNRVALIDFGTTSFSERATLNWFRLSILALSQRNYSEAADLYLLLAGTLPAGVDVDVIRAEFLQALYQWGDRTEVPELPYHDKSIAAIYNAVLEILFKHHCTMEWALLRIRRGLETLDASLIHLYPNCNYSEIAQTYSRRAAGRRLEGDDERPGERLASPAQVFEIGERVQEYALYQATILRRHLRVFQGASNKAIDLLSTAVTQMAVVGAAGTIIAAAIWAAQHRPPWLGFLGADAVAGLAALTPAYDSQIWIALTAAGVYVSVALIRLRHRLRRPERRASDRVAAV